MTKSIKEEITSKKNTIFNLFNLQQEYSFLFEKMNGITDQLILESKLKTNNHEGNKQRKKGRN
jgi:hypothetical protein